MSEIPQYVEHNVPPSLSGVFTRLLELKKSGDDLQTFPARPTGHNYVGWLPNGTGAASAEGTSFELSPRICHYSGQLTTFDAEYRLQGPCHHFLAECTAIGASRLINRNLTTLVNRCEMFPPPVSGPSTIETFRTILYTLASDLGPGDRTVEDAAARISECNGDISIAQLAQDLKISERQLHKTFAYHVGISPKAFALIKKVIFVLKSLQQNPASDITDLAYEGGFYDQAHLTKVFKLYMRTTPRRLRLDEDGVLQSIVANA